MWAGAAHSQRLPGPQPGNGGEGLTPAAPPYDEYLISYKDRSDALEERHKSFTHNNWGIFHPVILHNGRITGNWRKTSGRGVEPCQATFFDGCRPAAKPLVAAAVKRYCAFLAG
ncbi:MAG: winged helix DNA-binding domain-containing protein [Alistipes sp.]|nr:winged helix DNA-binding domain-containing protein [Alistipes sp.]